jgi:hypothetical protein
MAIVVDFLTDTLQLGNGREELAAGVWATAAKPESSKPRAGPRYSRQADTRCTRWEPAL